MLDSNRCFSFKFLPKVFHFDALLSQECMCCNSMTCACICMLQSEEEGNYKPFLSDKIQPSPPRGIGWATSIVVACGL